MHNCTYSLASGVLQVSMHIDSLVPRLLQVSMHKASSLVYYKYLCTQPRPSFITSIYAHSLVSLALQVSIAYTRVTRLCHKALSLVYYKYVCTQLVPRALEVSMHKGYTRGTQLCHIASSLGNCMSLNTM